MPQPVPGVNFPAQTPAEGEREDVRKLLFQYGPTASQRYEKWGEEHPYQQFAAETAFDVGTGLIPYGKIAKRVPGLRNIGEILELAAKANQGIGGWGEGAQIAPEYRHPKKRELNEELDQLKTEQDFQSWHHDPRGVRGRAIMDMRTAVNERIAQLNAGITDESPLPFTIDVFRGSGRSGNVPGRGQFHTPDVNAAARFNYERGEEGRGKYFPNWQDEVNAMRATEARTLSYKKPLLVPNDINQLPAMLKAQGIKVTPEMDAKFGKMLSGMENEFNKTGKNLEDMNPAELRRVERWLMKQEKFFTQIAKDNGHDVVLRFGGNAIPEAIVVDDRVIQKKMFSGEPGYERTGPGTRPQAPIPQQSQKQHHAREIVDYYHDMMGALQDMVDQGKLKSITPEMGRRVQAIGKVAKLYNTSPRDVTPDMVDKYLAAQDKPAPIPAGKMTRQQRRAAERQAAKTGTAPTKIEPFEP